ncbi:alkaline phosphatase family protein [Candidatus Nanosalina sp. VS9-1]|uniref:alkaline phosphatase family protein n=1 Tax=Candidatus Nanosalina sp. VS9-1 TaxID=3388566 RepID=UPI0039E12E86
MTENVLVVAFDGMDKELVEEFDLENIPQEEFGDIDNSTGIKNRMTSELFASFITGETYRDHGVEGLSKKLTFRDKISKHLIPDFLVSHVRGFRTLRDVIKQSKSLEDTNYIRDDLQVETIFEEIDASLPLYVPSYNPSMYWLVALPHAVVRYYGEERFVEESRHDTEVRLRQGTATQPAFFDVSKDFWDFIMLHLHDPDAFQDTGLGDLEEEYERLDDIAGQILEEYGDEWTVIFMSDHGRPEKKSGPHEHNKNAFYSCNRELFGDETPHITDFYDKILELTDNEDKIK